MENAPVEPASCHVSPVSETPLQEPDDPRFLPSLWRRNWPGPIVTALIYLVFWQTTLRIPSGDIFIVWATTIISLLIVLLFTVLIARSLTGIRSIVVNLVAAGALALPLVLGPILIRTFPHWRGWAHLAPGLRFYSHGVHRLPGLHELLLIWLAATIGAAIARLVREFKMLLPMAIALAAVDIYVVFGGGLVTQANSGHSPIASAAMSALTVRLPTTGPRTGAAPMQLSVGFADFLFTSLFFACFARFATPSKRTFWVLFATLVGYMLLVFFFSLDLPALVPIALVVIGMNARRFQFARSEAFAMLYAGILVLAILGGMILWSR